MIRALVVVNPAAGRAGRGAVLDRSLGVLAGAWRLDVRRPASSDETRALGRAAPGHDVAVVAGGDGTLSMFLRDYPPDGPPVTVLPFGTANVVARDLGLPLAPEAAARSLLRPARRAVDVGEVQWASGERRRFILSVGAGAVAEAVAWADGSIRAAPASKRIFGRWLYAAALVRSLGQPAPVAVEADGERLEGIAAIAVATRHYAGGLLPAPDARAGDGLIDLLVIGGRFACLGAAAAGLAGLAARGPGVRHRRVEAFRILSAGPLEVDGDPAPPAPADVALVGRLVMLGAMR